MSSYWLADLHPQITLPGTPSPSGAQTAHASPVSVDYSHVVCRHPSVCVLVDILLAPFASLTGKSSPLMPVIGPAPPGVVDCDPADAGVA
jgi:hypothetical protein